MNTIAIQVSEDAVERWLVDHASDGNKYPDALKKLTDLINETWSSGGCSRGFNITEVARGNECCCGRDGSGENHEDIPTMQELRNDILEYNHEVTY